jgi:NADH-quinone oxidoreductase subunit J
MMLVIVYVGAVAVLFLFVVMMLDIDIAEFGQRLRQHAIVGGTVGMVLLGELLMVVRLWGEGAPRIGAETALATPAGVTNTEALGALLYTHYIYAFQASGLILLVAMIGAIVLTQRRRKDVQRQSVPGQVARARTVRTVKMGSGEGVGIPGDAKKIQEAAE